MPVFHELFPGVIVYPYIYIVFFDIIELSESQCTEVIDSLILRTDLFLIHGSSFILSVGALRVVFFLFSCFPVIRVYVGTKRKIIDDQVSVLNEIGAGKEPVISSVANL